MNTKRRGKYHKQTHDKQFTKINKSSDFYCYIDTYEHRLIIMPKQCNNTCEPAANNDGTNLNCNVIHM